MPLHARVFNYILDHNEYDENKLMIFLGIKRSRLPNIKNYLYHRILENIERFNRNKMLSSEIRTLLGYAELLQRKKLFAQSQK